MQFAWLGHPGSGRTTLAALLARAFAERGERVLAIDAALDARLAARLGVRATARVQSFGSGGDDAAPRLRPVSRKADLTGAFGALQADALQVLALHADHEGPGGEGASAARCSCAADAAQLQREGIASFGPAQVVMDTEAGLAPLARGGLDDAACALVVVEPYRRALETAERLCKALSQRAQDRPREAAAARWRVVANRVQGEDDRAAIEAFCRRHGIEVFAWVGFDSALQDNDAPVAASTTAFEAVREMAARLAPPVIVR